MNTLIDTEFPLGGTLFETFFLMPNRLFKTIIKTYNK